jgi:hypothetical protein
VNTLAKTMIDTSLALMFYPYAPDRLEKRIEAHESNLILSGGYIAASIMWQIKTGTAPTVECAIKTISFLDQELSTQDVQDIWRDYLPIAPLWAAFAAMQGENKSMLCLRDEDSVMEFAGMVREFFILAKATDDNFTESLLKVPGFSLIAFYSKLPKAKPSYPVIPKKTFSGQMVLH